MNSRILDLFIKENSAWEDMISRQRGEIPMLDQLVTHIIEQKEEKKQLKEEKSKIFHHLKYEMQMQEKHMDELKEELQKQQQYLLFERKNTIGKKYSLDTFFSQKVLRERIREVERGFLELKSHFFNYLATI
jgi:hypothetical protein